jgi:DNA-binding SARP family transcriptional activator
MSLLRISLFQKFSLQCDGHAIDCIRSQKAQELFCYLLIFRNRSHHREVLAEKLWSDLKIDRTKKYLRKAVWQLQSSLNSISDCAIRDLLKIEPEWLEVDTENCCWVDIGSFEESFKKVRGIRGKNLNQSDFEALRQAIGLYKGDLLEGWYQSWCIYERERFKEMLIRIYSKLMSFCEANHDYESGIEYGHHLLRYDPAHERTHRRLMRIHFLDGDRTAALRQYERCKRTLQADLSVDPGERTTRLYQEIVGGDEEISQEIVQIKRQHPTTSSSRVLFTLSWIRNRLASQADVQEKLLDEIKELEKALKHYE